MIYVGAIVFLIVESVQGIVDTCRTDHDVDAIIFVANRLHDPLVILEIADVALHEDMLVAFEFAYWSFPCKQVKDYENYHIFLKLSGWEN